MSIVGAYIEVAESVNRRDPIARVNLREDLRQFMGTTQSLANHSEDPLVITLAGRLIAECNLALSRLREGR